MHFSIRSLKKPMILVGLLVVGSSASFAHGIDSGGGDKRPADFGAAWFLGTRPIRYCIEAAPAYGMDTAALHSSIEKAVSIWKDYVVTRNVNGNRKPDEQLDLNFVFQSQCDGTADIQFLFGVENRKVAAGKRTLTDPSFFFVRERYDRQNGWGNGFVWVAPPKTISPPPSDLTPQESVVVALLHELGHVLGCGHIDGTIMREDIADSISPWPTIDGERLLFIGSPIQFHKSYSVSAGLDQGTYDSSFEHFSGKKAKDGVRLDLQVSTPASDAIRAVLNLSSGGNSTEVIFDSVLPSSGIGNNSIYMIRGEDIFKSANSTRVYSEMQTGLVIYGTIKGRSGVPVFAGLEFNMNASGATPSNGVRGPVSLFYVENNQRTTLFY